MKIVRLVVKQIKGVRRIEVLAHPGGLHVAQDGQRHRHLFAGPE